MMPERTHTTRDGVPFAVREATADDAEQLLAGAEAVIAERLDVLITRPEEFSISVEEERRWIQGHADADNSVLLVAVLADDIVGWASLRGSTRTRTRHTAELGITVARPWRGQGIGTAMMLGLIDWATDNPVLVKVKLGAIATNRRAIGLYRRLGFVEEGQLPREFRRADGTFLDGVLMYRFVERT